MKDGNEPVEICKYCDEPVYSVLTNGMCLNCYQNDIIENRQADIEAKHDYYDGNMFQWILNKGVLSIMASKEYYCKGCGNNNNGWCPVKQSNHLRGITECKYKTPAGVKSDLSEIDLEAEKLVVNTAERYKEIVVKKTAPSSENVFEKSLSSRGNNEGYVVMGKRAMFHNLQRQILVMSESQSTIDVNELKQLMVSLEQMLLIDEKVHGIKYDSEIDADIIKESKLISVQWLREVGAYKEKK